MQKPNKVLNGQSYKPSGSFADDILTEPQKKELKGIIDNLVEERVQERIKRFSDKYTKFIVESATRKIVDRVKGDLSEKINQKLSYIQEQSDKICRSVIIESANKVSDSKLKTKQIIKKIENETPKIIKTLAEENTKELAKEAIAAIEENKRLCESFSNIKKGMERAGFLINEDIDKAIENERNEKLMLRTKLVEAKRNLKIEQLTEGLLPSQKKEIKSLLDDCTTATMVEDKFPLVKDKIMRLNTHVEQLVENKKEKVEEVFNEEEILTNFLSVVKHF